ncbi:hypothetical protein PR202_ga23825 [Eleusine coracana subsp. coracana]|uniref:Inosine/uridine-preferring nucleoside hydrolase domain-containing protein n=1 Tax=Eleusine coracana subsp. coracana TaxID=191504 RepID=A0AAV5D7V1_ELECO|nr:hypothetical protein PR202_ga23825 [Eleusine coracana subsp. coracana]
MAIFVALRSPELEVLGLTIHVRQRAHPSRHAQRAALHLLETVGRTDVPVAEGSHVTIKNFPAPVTKPVSQSAAAFLVEQATLHPGQVTVVALGPLTNIAQALELDPSFAKKIRQIVILGGAYSVNGNVNPAAESNIFGDPDAADTVFTCGADILAVGINITQQVIFSDADREKLEQSDSKYARHLCKILRHYFDYHRDVYLRKDADREKLEQCDSKYARYLCKIMGIYFDYHKDAYFIKGVYLHDPTTLIAAVNPSLLTYTEGVVRVQTVGITRGLTVFDNTKKRYAEVTPWTDKPIVKVAVTVDAPAVVELMMQSA